MREALAVRRVREGGAGPVFDEVAQMEWACGLVLPGMTSVHSRSAYRTGLKMFFVWLHQESTSKNFTKALVQSYRAHLVKKAHTAGFSAAWVNLRLSPIRKLAAEMADNGHLDPAVAAAVGRVRGMERRGVRVGNWLLQDQAFELLNAPDPLKLAGKRDRVILALLLGCGLRRAELIRVRVEDVQQREGRWVIPDMTGKGNRVRTVPIPAWVKDGIDKWLVASGVESGRLIRPINKAGRLAGHELRDEKAIWRVVTRYAKKTSLGDLAPHDLRRTCAKLCRKSGEPIEQIQQLLGHASVQTTERYLGTEQNLTHAANDSIRLGWK